MIKPYYTTYPFPAWYWFDIAVYGEFKPKTGNLPTALFDRLKSGTPRGRSRWYASEEDAQADHQQATR